MPGTRLLNDEAYKLISVRATTTPVNLKPWKTFRCFQLNRRTTTRSDGNNNNVAATGSFPGQGHNFYSWIFSVIFSVQIL